MKERHGPPYIYATWLSGLLSGENSCEFAVWIKANFQDYPTVPEDKDWAEWNLRHTSLLNKERARLESEGCTVYTEAQNKFTIKGRLATLGGKPDLVSVSPEGRIVVHDPKGGKPKASHLVQVMIYQWALPLAFKRFKGKSIDGRVVYSDHSVDIPAEKLNGFTEKIPELIKRLVGGPARKVPSVYECRFCPHTKETCPERVGQPETITDTDLF